MEVIKSILKNSSDTNHTQPQTLSTLLCFSHLRWDFVYQRPQHLLTRFATIFPVYFIEEPHWDATDGATLSFTSKADNLWVVTPHLPKNCPSDLAVKLQKTMLDKFLKNKDLSDMIFWYYTPMALPFTNHYTPGVVVYDCMDELSNFKNAPQQLKDLEQKLFAKSDIVFTGGHSLYEAKKNLHPNIYSFPSSIDKKHFEQARLITEEPEDQKHIGGNRLGFYGVIDERFDLELIREIAEKRPDWNIILIGPVVKINRDTLPKRANIHYLGNKSYNELPSYVASWDVALIPFLLNEATRFISPTKTPEYLAAGVPVISTAIRDVVYPYGDEGIVKIASDSEGFIEAAEQYMKMEKATWLPEVDDFLMDKSWSGTFTDMMNKIKTTVKGKQQRA